MTADILREAAAKMREQAEAATPGPWESIPAGAWTGRVFASEDMVAKISTETSDDHGNAEHIASWHPAVALAVADWLDAMADHIDVWTKDYEPGEIRHCDVGTPADSNCVDAALAVARTYLGRDA